MNSPSEIGKLYVKVGKGKMELPVSKMFVLGIFAGAYIAFGAVCSQAVAVSIPLQSVAKAAGAFVFPIGLMMVLVAGSELFTGNCLLVIPVLEGEGTMSEMLKNWLFVYIGNLVGGVMVAAACTYGHVYSLFDQQLAASVVAMAAGKVSLSFGDALIRGILCNVLVCVAVWISFAAKELAGKILGLMLPVAAFVLCGFEHSVANMYFISSGIMTSSEYGIAAEGLTWGSMFVNNLIPVTLGNIIGGSVIVGLGYWFCYIRKNSPVMENVPGQEMKRHRDRRTGAFSRIQ